MSKNRMTDAERTGLVEAYKLWQPDSGQSADDLARSFGVSRSAMYTLLRREGIPLKTGRGNRHAMNGQEPIMSDMGRVLATVMLDQLTDLKNRVRELEIENLELRQKVASRV